MLFRRMVMGQAHARGRVSYLKELTLDAEERTLRLISEGSIGDFAGTLAWAV